MNTNETLKENLDEAFKESDDVTDLPKHELDVFISYSSLNKNVADTVVSNFEQHGIRCWYAPRDIMPGQEWVTAIHEAINSCKLFVLIYTDSSNESKQVANEVALAFNSGKTLIPFRLSDTEMSTELEYYLTRVHWLDAVNPPLIQSIENLREYSEKILKGNVPKESKVKNASTVKIVTKQPTWIIPLVVAIIGFFVVIIVLILNKDKSDTTSNITTEKSAINVNDTSEIKTGKASENVKNDDESKPDTDSNDLGINIDKDSEKDVNTEKNDNLIDTEETDQKDIIDDDQEKTPDPQSYFTIAYDYQKGNDKENNFELAYENYMLTGDAVTTDPDIVKAIYDLGVRFANEDGVEQNYQKALNLYKKAMECGSLSAVNALGNAYYLGDGVDEDYSKAFEYFELSASGGNEIGQYNVGMMYENGYGVEQNKEKALEYYKMSADQGYSLAANAYKRLLK